MSERFATRREERKRQLAWFELMSMIDTDSNKRENRWKHLAVKLPPIAVMS